MRCTNLQLAEVPDVDAALVHQRGQRHPVLRGGGWVSQVGRQPRQDHVAKELAGVLRQISATVSLSQLGDSM